ncbi:hypothetical protein AMJ52_01190 [candidate division TA06 bacterium DG_78]|uniref:Secretion system C-terminal sorting domain-containing protein n=1 Tax=candidate division TA06 bacterium DG_78 TaxID=1703772 RepID=A0A0S7YID8_UNCT6|nr:MAG: hypothetical protein AMJ52_01190 [candidate division TA06 bacterium DG_78]
MKEKILWKRRVIVGCIMAFFLGGFAHAQIERWVYTYDESELMDANAKSIVYGADSNIYASGFLDRPNTRQDFTVLSVNASGTYEWDYLLDGLGQFSYDVAHDVVYQADGNIYAAGQIVPWSSYSSDFAVVNVSNWGAQRWLYTYNGTSNSNDVANAIVATDFVVTAAGYSTNSGTAADFTVISFMTNNGMALPVYTYNGSASGIDEARDLVYDENTFIYAAGYSTETDNGKDIVVIKLDLVGNEKWVYTYDGSGTNADEAYSIILGQDGHLYVAGYSTESGSDRDFTVISLDTLGNERWVYSTTNNNKEEAFAIVYGADHYIYAAGYRLDLLNEENFFVVKLDTLGTNQWTYQYNGPIDHAEDVAKAIVYGVDDNIYIAGYSSQVMGQRRDFTVISLDTLKNERWMYTYNGQADSNDVANAIVYGDDGNLYAAGYLNARDFAIISIDPAMRPSLWTNPNFFMVMIDSGQTEDRDLKIANVGPETSVLEWSLSERPPVDWLSVDTTNGVLESGDTVLVTVSFDATALTPSMYYDTLEITSNDPNNLTKDIWIKLTVGSPGVADHPESHMEDRCELLSSLFNKTITLRFTQPSHTPCTITIYNALGARVYETTLSATHALVNMDNQCIARLSRGVYFLSVSRSENVYPVMKIVKY